MTERVLYVVIPEELKYRLDRYALENKLTLRDATIKNLDEILPKYNVSEES